MNVSSTHINTFSHLCLPLTGLSHTMFKLFQRLFPSKPQATAPRVTVYPYTDPRPRLIDIADPDPVFCAIDQFGETMAVYDDEETVLPASEADVVDDDDKADDAEHRLMFDDYSDPFNLVAAKEAALGLPLVGCSDVRLPFNDPAPLKLHQRL